MDFQMFASLPASDIGRARSWYESVLGVEPMDVGDGAVALFTAGGSAFMVYESEFAGTNRATAAGLAVADFDAAITELRARGVIFEEYDLGPDTTFVDGVATQEDGRRSAWFTDSEGNILVVAEDPR